MIINAFIETYHINMTLHRYCFSKKKRKKKGLHMYLKKFTEINQ